MIDWRDKHGKTPAMMCSSHAQTSYSNFRDSSKYSHLRLISLTKTLTFLPPSIDKTRNVSPFAYCVVKTRRHFPLIPELYAAAAQQASWCSSHEVLCPVSGTENDEAETAKTSKHTHSSDTFDPRPRRDVSSNYSERSNTDFWKLWNKNLDSVTWVQPQLTTRQVGIYAFN